MLDQHGIEYRYREYRTERLGEDEIRDVLRKLGVRAHHVLRRNDRAYKELGMTGAEDEDTVVRLMAEHPTLLQRPIGLRDGRAALGRPVENLLALAEDG